MGQRSGAINFDAANIINGNVLNIKALADSAAASPLRQDGTDELTRVSQGEAQKGRGRNLSPPVAFRSKTRSLNSWNVLDQPLHVYLSCLSVNMK